MKKNLESKESSVEEKSRDKSQLIGKLEAAQAGIDRKEKVINDFATPVRTSYLSLMRAQASSYHDRLHAVLGDPHARVEYHGGFRVPVGEDGHWLHLRYEDINNEYGCRTRPPKGSDRDDFLLSCLP